MRLLDRLGSHGAAFELKDAPLVVDLRLGPQRFDELNPFAESPHAALAGYLKLGVVVVPAESDTEDRPAVAHVVERRDLVGDVDGVADRQGDPGGAGAD